MVGISIWTEYKASDVMKIEIFPFWSLIWGETTLIWQMEDYQIDMKLEK